MTDDDVLAQEQEEVQEVVQEVVIATEPTPTVDVPASLIQEQLAKRLKCNSSTINRNRVKVGLDFTDWSRDRDPDGIGWRFDDDAKLFYPVS